MVGKRERESLGCSSCTGGVNQEGTSAVRSGTVGWWLVGGWL